jgi:hypothetical protein
MSKPNQDARFQAKAKKANTKPNISIRESAPSPTKFFERLKSTADSVVVGVKYYGACKEIWGIATILLGLLGYNYGTASTASLSPKAEPEMAAPETGSTKPWDPKFSGCLKIKSMSEAFISLGGGPTKAKQAVFDLSIKGLSVCEPGWSATIDAVFPQGSDGQLTVIASDAETRKFKLQFNATADGHRFRDGTPVKITVSSLVALNDSEYMVGTGVNLTLRKVASKPQTKAPTTSVNEKNAAPSTDSWFHRNFGIENVVRAEPPTGSVKNDTEKD